MPPEVKLRVVWLGVLAVVVGVVGVAMILALLATWRNYNRRGDLLDKSRALREEQWGEKPASPDAWSESAKRHREVEPPPAAEDGDDAYP